MTGPTERGLVRRAVFGILLGILHVSTTPAEAHDHSCIHDKSPGLHREHMRSLPEGFSHSAPGLLSNTAYQPFKITADIQDLESTITASTVASGQDPVRLRALLRETLVPSAVGYFERALGVKPAAPRAVLFPPSCAVAGENPCAAAAATTPCGTATIPDSMLYGLGKQGTGVEGTDYVLFVTAQATASCISSSGASTGTIAYASYCYRGNAAWLDRPIAGYVNFCPHMLSDEEAKWSKGLSTAIHEIAHALVFSSSLYPWFRDSDGNPRTTRSSSSGSPPIVTYTPPPGSPASCTPYLVHEAGNSTLQSVTARGLDVWLVVTPEVVAKAREHYGCSTIVGMQLENEPTSSCSVGRPASHWDQRVAMAEFMTPVSQHDSSFSPLTLALFKDSGWYSVNYTSGATIAMHWGKDAGCSFIDEKCLSLNAGTGLTTSPFPAHFCTAQGSRQCTTERKFKGVCLVKTHDAALPSAYQYFSNTAVGGWGLQADHCPTVANYDNGDCRQPENYPTYNFGGETFGSNSRCFDSSFKQNVAGYRTTSTPVTRCYPVRACDSATMSYEVGLAVVPDSTSTVNFPLTWYSCSSSSTTITPGGANAVAYSFSGTITCAPYTIVCDGSDAAAAAMIINATEVALMAASALSSATEVINASNATKSAMCTDTAATGASDKYGDGCNLYGTHTAWCNSYDDDDFKSADVCCACGGGSTKVAVPNTCKDQDFGATSRNGGTCSSYVGHTSWCGDAGRDDRDFESSVMCCTCGGGSTAPGREFSTLYLCNDTAALALDSQSKGCEHYWYTKEHCGDYDDGDFTADSVCCGCGGGSAGAVAISASSTLSGMTAASFDTPSNRNAFKAALASAVSVLASNVLITAITDAESALLSKGNGSVTVSFTITGVSASKQRGLITTLESSNGSSTLVANLQLQGLSGITGASFSGVSANTSPAAATAEAPPVVTAPEEALPGAAAAAPAPAKVGSSEGAATAGSDSVDSSFIVIMAVSLLAVCVAMVVLKRCCCPVGVKKVAPAAETEGASVSYRDEERPVGSDEMSAPIPI